MGCDCWNSPPAPAPQTELPSRRDRFLDELRRHLEKGHTQSLLTRAGVGPDQHAEALRRLEAWLLSGAPKDPDRPDWMYSLPVPRFPDAFDDSGLTDKAWHALILSDLAWYVRVTTDLYGVMLNHVENTNA